MGGIGNAYGALSAGILLGLVIEWSTLFIDTRWKTAIGFLVLILVLIIRPQGIFGRARTSRWTSSSRALRCGHLPGVHRRQLLDRRRILAGTYTVFSLGLQLNVGFTGIDNFGLAAFMAIGAYAMAILTVETASGSGSPYRSRS